MASSSPAHSHHPHDVTSPSQQNEANNPPATSTFSPSHAEPTDNSGNLLHREEVFDQLYTNLEALRTHMKNVNKAFRKDLPKLENAPTTSNSAATPSKLVKLFRTDLNLEYAGTSNTETIMQAELPFRLLDQVEQYVDDLLNIPSAEVTHKRARAKRAALTQGNLGKVQRWLDQLEDSEEGDGEGNTIEGEGV